MELSKENQEWLEKSKGTVTYHYIHVSDVKAKLIELETENKALHKMLKETEKFTGESALKLSGQMLKKDYEEILNHQQKVNKQWNT